MRGRIGPRMPPRDSPKPVVAIEREILRTLCGNAVSSADWLRTMVRLARHSWKEPEHKVVYGALQALRTSDAQARRDQLPAQATRMGFPDVDWQLYLTVDADLGERLDQMIDTLEKIP